MTVGRPLKTIVAKVAASAPVRSLVRVAMRRTVNIVYYHDAGLSRPLYQEFYGGCTVERFRQDLEFLAAHFELVSLERALELAQGETDLRKPAVAVTFDDGFNLNREDLLSLFDEFNVRITTFLITRCVDNHELMWRNKLSVVRSSVPEAVYVREYNALMGKAGYPPIAAGDELMPASRGWAMARKDELADALWHQCNLPPLEKYLQEYQPYFSWAGLEAWIQAGHGVGLHTFSHPRCSQLNEQEAEAEILRPGRDLAQKLRLARIPFSYPFGERLRPELEARIFNDPLFSCALGIRGFVRRGRPGTRLERAGIEESGANWQVAAKALLSGTRA